MIKIDKFIENFKKGFDKEQIETLFTKGNCFHFALILEGLYDGEIVYDQNEFHFAFLHKEKVYDITGEIPYDFSFIKWEELEEYDSEEHYQLMRDCVFKI